MNTNDEQTRYGGRAPMVSDKEMSAMQEHHDFMFSGHQVMPTNAHHYGLLDMRKAYEKLITTGKLRVVGEVEAPLKHVDMDEWWTCSGCKESFLSYHNPPNYCPGCGNKLKR